MKKKKASKTKYSEKFLFKLVQAIFAEHPNLKADIAGHVGLEKGEELLVKMIQDGLFKVSKDNNGYYLEMS